MEQFLTSLSPALRAEVEKALAADGGKQRLDAVVSPYRQGDEGEWPTEPDTAEFVAREFLARSASITDYRPPSYGAAGLTGAAAAALVGGAVSATAGAGAVVLSSKAMERYWLSMAAYSLGIDPRVAKAVRLVVERVNKEFDWFGMGRAVGRGPYMQKLHIVFGQPYEQYMRQQLTGALAKSAWRGARSGLVHHAGKVGDFSQNSWVANYVDRFASNQRALSERTLRTLAESSLEQGLSERAITARLRAMWALAPGEVTTVDNYRKALAAQNPPGRVNSLVSRHISRLVDRRIETIAATETITTFNLGRERDWMQAVQDGLMPLGTKKMWLTGKDELVCKVCRALDGQTAALGETFETEYGNILVPSIHPNCRCLIIPVTGAEASTADFSGEMVLPPQEVTKREIKVKEHQRSDGSTVKEHWRKLKEGVQDFDAKDALKLFGIGSATALGAVYLRNPKMLREAARFAGDTATRGVSRQRQFKPVSQDEAFKLFDDFRFGDYTTRVRSVEKVSDASWTVEGAVFHKQEFAGMFHRQVSLDRTRVHHSLFELDEIHQGKGFGSAWNKHLFAQYKGKGFQRVELLANMEVGGYAWARQGFRPRTNRDASLALTQALDKNIDVAKWPLADQKRLDDLYQRSFQHLSAVKRGRSLDDGAEVNRAFTELEKVTSWDDLMGFSKAAQKDLLLGSSWSGSLDLRTFAGFAKHYGGPDGKQDHKSGTPQSIHGSGGGGQAGASSSTPGGPDFRDILPEPTTAASVLVGAAAIMVTRGKVRSMGQLASQMRKVNTEAARGLQSARHGQILNYDVRALDVMTEGYGFRLGNSSHIRHMANAMLRGEDLFTFGGKPNPVMVMVYRDGAQVLDGKHRLAAARLVGRGQVPVQVAKIDTPMPRPQTFRQHWDELRRRHTQAELAARQTPTNVQPFRARNLTEAERRFNTWMQRRSAGADEDIFRAMGIERGVSKRMLEQMWRDYEELTT